MKGCSSCGGKVIGLISDDAILFKCEDCGNIIKKVNKYKKDFLTKYRT